MSNYVWNKVVCSKETLEKYFIDYDPFGDGSPREEPYISFNQLFSVRSLNEHSEKYGVHISYGYSFSWMQQGDGTYEIKFCTRWEYPIRAILRAIELAHDTVWYAVEENHIYVSRFYWDNGVKEDILRIEEAFDDWEEDKENFIDSLKDPDDSVWYFLPTLKEPWQDWPSTDNFRRYLDTPVVHVPLTFIT